jgi:hypothetical protein
VNEICGRVCLCLLSCHRSDGADVGDIPDVLRPADSYLDTSSHTLLVIWAIVILMLIWLRSHKWLLVGLLLLDGFLRHLFWFHPMKVCLVRFYLAALRGCPILNVCLFVCHGNYALVGLCKAQEYCTPHCRGESPQNRRRLVLLRIYIRAHSVIKLSASAPADEIRVYRSQITIGPPNPRGRSD